MNKNILFILAVCLVAVLSRSGLAEDSSKEPFSNADSGKPYGEGPHAAVDVPSGMELINVGGIRMIVPQGAKVEKKGSLLIMESADEFMVRNFKEMKERLEKTEASQKDLSKAVEDLKSEITGLRKK